MTKIRAALTYGGFTLGQGSGTATFLISLGLAKAGMHIVQ